MTGIGFRLGHSMSSPSVLVIWQGAMLIQDDGFTWLSSAGEDAKADL